MTGTHELLIGGQRSGKSRLAETRAAGWLAASPGHQAVLVATALAHDDEMRARIQRHRDDRAARVPRLRTVEEAIALPEVLLAQATPATMLVVDCLTLWLANLLMPAQGAGLSVAEAEARIDALVAALARCPGPVLLVGNEIGLGVIPMGREVREFVDTLGRLNQGVAAACSRVTLMVAGLPLVLKESS